MTKVKQLLGISYELPLKNNNSDTKMNQLDGKKYEKTESKLIQLFGKTNGVAISYKYSKNRIQELDEQIMKMAKKEKNAKTRLLLMEEQVNEQKQLYQQLKNKKCPLFSSFKTKGKNILKKTQGQ